MKAAGGCGVGQLSRSAGASPYAVPRLYASGNNAGVVIGDIITGAIARRLKSFANDGNNINNHQGTGISVQAGSGGTLTAGVQQVAIYNNTFDGNGNIEHSKLTVEFDDRIATGVLQLPGLPTPAKGINGLDVVLWTEVARQ